MNYIITRIRGLTNKIDQWINEIISIGIYCGISNYYITVKKIGRKNSSKTIDQFKISKKSNDFASITSELIRDFNIDCTKANVFISLSEKIPIKINELTIDLDLFSSINEVNIYILEEVLPAGVNNSDFCLRYMNQSNTNQILISILKKNQLKKISNIVTYYDPTQYWRIIALKQINPQLIYDELQILDLSNENYLSYINDKGQEIDNYEQFASKMLASIGGSNNYELNFAIDQRKKKWQQKHTLFEIQRYLKSASVFLIFLIFILFIFFGFYIHKENKITDEFEIHTIKEFDEFNSKLGILKKQISEISSLTEGKRNYSPILSYIVENTPERVQFKKIVLNQNQFQINGSSLDREPINIFYKKIEAFPIIKGIEKFEIENIIEKNNNKILYVFTLFVNI